MGCCIAEEMKVVRIRHSAEYGILNQRWKHFPKFKEAPNNMYDTWGDINPLNAKLNPICHYLALLGAHHVLHVSRIMFRQDSNRVAMHIKDHGT